MARRESRENRLFLTARERIAIAEMFVEVRKTFAELSDSPKKAGLLVAPRTYLEEIDLYIDQLRADYAPSPGDCRRWVQLLGGLVRGRFPAGVAGDHMFDQCCDMVRLLRAGGPLT